MRSAYGIILLPPPDLAVQMVEYSKRLAARTVNPTMSLDTDERPPHLTLLHVECDEDVASSWWSQAKALLEPSYPITLTGLAFTPLPSGDYYVPEGGLYFGLQARYSNALRQVHLRLLDLARELGARPLEATGENFAPHITLGILQGFPVDEPPVPPEIVTATARGEPAFGHLGAYGTFPTLTEQRPL